MESQETSPKLEEPQSKRVAKIRVSIPLLNNILPAGTKVLAVQANEYLDVVELVVEHPSFDPLHQGDPLPVRPVMFYRENCEKGHTWVSKVTYDAA